MTTANNIANVKVLRVEDRTYHRLGDYWEKGPVIVSHMRRWGCCICRMQAANLSTLKPELDRAGVALVGIGVEELGYNDFKRLGFFDGELFIDEKKASYQELGFKKNSWRNLWGIFGGVLNIVNKAKKLGYSNITEGDKSQMGGTMVIGKGGKVLYQHKQDNDDFEPNYTDLLKSLDIEVPADLAGRMYRNAAPGS